MHLFKAILGLVVATLLTLYYGNSFVDMIRRPIDAALTRNKLFNQEEVTEYWSQVKGWSQETRDDSQSGSKNGGAGKMRRPRRQTRRRFWSTSNRRNCYAFCTAPTRRDTRLRRRIRTKRRFRFRSLPDEFRDFRQTTVASNRPITLNVQEAFMMYIKVSFVAGFVMASPWIFYQMWQFVAAGLYPHERKYVHVYLPMSIGLFLIGVFFAFYLALAARARFSAGLQPLAGSRAANSTFRMGEFCYSSARHVRHQLSITVDHAVSRTNRNCRRSPITVPGRRLAVFVDGGGVHAAHPGSRRGNDDADVRSPRHSLRVRHSAVRHWKIERPFEEPAIG